MKARVVASFDFAHSSPGAIILMILAAMLTCEVYAHQVDVTCAGWQVPFVTSVVNTYACCAAILGCGGRGHVA